MNEINLYEALKTMRTLSELGAGFSITFLTYNKNGTSNGIKKVTKCWLRKGYKDNQSEMAKYLISYIDEGNNNRQFYLPLLLSFNEKKITTIR